MEKKHIKMYLLPVLVFMLGGLILSAVLCNSYRTNQTQVRTVAELNAVTYAERLQNDMLRGTTITETLEDIIISGNGNIEKFQYIAENLMTDYIQSIQIAPDGVVTDIYPEAGNEAGKIDLINDKKRGKLCRYG